MNIWLKTAQSQKNDKETSLSSGPTVHTVFSTNGHILPEMWQNITRNSENLKIKNKKMAQYVKMHHISRKPTNKPKATSKSGKIQSPKTVRFAIEFISETDPQNLNTIYKVEDTLNEGIEDEMIKTDNNKITLSSDDSSSSKITQI